MKNTCTSVSFLRYLILNHLSLNYFEFFFKTLYIRQMVEFLEKKCIQGVKDMTSPDVKTYRKCCEALCSFLIIYNFRYFIVTRLSWHFFILAKVLVLKCCFSSSHFFVIVKFHFWGFLLTFIIL